MRILSKLLSRLRASPTSKSAAADARERYCKRMEEALGSFRFGVLGCLLYGNPERHFNPPEGVDLIQEFRSHLERLWMRAAREKSQYPPIVPAGLLTYGQLEMAEVVLANLMPEPIAEGWCNWLAFQITACLLPLPFELKNYRGWVEGTPMAEAVRAWFVANRERLAWDARHERFVLLPAT